MFSATFPDDIQVAAQDFLNDYLFLTVGIVGGACSDVQQEFHEVAKFDKREKLGELMQDPARDPKERTLIFVQVIAFKCFSIDSIQIYFSRPRRMPTFWPATCLRKGFPPRVFTATGFRGRGRRRCTISVLAVSQYWSPLL